MFVIGVMLVLLVAGSSQDGTESKTKGFTTTLSGLASAAMGKVNKVVFDKVDVNSIFNPILGEVTKRLGTSSCIAGIYLNVDNNDMTLKLIDGKMSDLQLMVTRINTVQEDTSTLTVSLNFTFPNLPIKYKFDYSSVRLVKKVERNGNVELVQNGPVTLEITVQLPKSQKKVEDMLAKNQCVAIIQDVKMSIKTALHTVKVDYESLASFFGLKVTEGSIKSMLLGLREDLQDNIKAAIQQLIEPVFRGNSFNCKDATYSAPVGAKAEKAIDCHHFNNAKKYKPQA